MTLEIPAGLADILPRAFTVGIETTIVELAELMDLNEHSSLTAASRVIDVLQLLKLELAPDPLAGELTTIRVLRRAGNEDQAESRVRHLLTQGEGPLIEFKSSLLCSMREWQQNGKKVELQALPGEVLKTICAFLNAGGGDLLVGAADDGSPCEGIQLDLETKGWNFDKWQLHFNSLVSSRFSDGVQIQPYIRSQMIHLGGYPIFHVNVMPRRIRSFVKREKDKPFEFFIRNGPQTLNLDLPSFYAHTTAFSAM